VSVLELIQQALNPNFILSLINVKTEATAWPTYIDKRQVGSNVSNKRQDLSIEEGGLRYAGKHLVIDLREARHLDDLNRIEHALRRCVDVAGATLLHIHLHHFTPNHGVSGVAVLAESHISIHTWPERNYAALDIFMCGNTQPEKCIHVLREVFETHEVDVTTLLRGEFQHEEVVTP
jgi:S-adenosylmethionine decarboxylase